MLIEVYKFIQRRLHMNTLLTTKEVMNNYKMPFKSLNTLRSNKFFISIQKRIKNKIYFNSSDIEKYLSDINSDVIVKNDIEFRKIPISKIHYVSKCGKYLSISTPDLTIYEPNFQSDGYCRFTITLKNGKQTKVCTHRAVYMAWIGEIKEGMEIDHIDSNNRNNNISNLRQISHKDNCKFQHKNFKGNYKLSKEKVFAIRKEPSELTLRELSEKYNISKSQISNIRRFVSFKNIKGN